MVSLDSSAAWHSARRMVSANRDMLVAIAGVFFLLPGLVAGIVVPPPLLTHGMDQQQMTDAVMRFYNGAGPILLVLSLPMLAGYLTLLAMLLDRERPTVGAAIGQALRLLPSYVVAQLLTALALSVLWVTVLGGLSMIMPQAIAVLVSLLVMIYPLIRVVLIGPEMVSQRLLNPIRAIIDGLSRTRGHFVGMLLYFAPALTLFVVVYGLVMIFVGVVLVNVSQGETQRVISEAIGAAMFAVGYTYFTAIVASAYRQIGPARDTGDAYTV